jgi:hypothetical protein
VMFRPRILAPEPVSKTEKVLIALESLGFSSGKSSGNKYATAPEGVFASNTALGAGEQWSRKRRIAKKNFPILKPPLQ